MRYQVRLHPTLDVLVSSIGEVFIPASGKNKAHWTFGRKDHKGYLRVTINGRKYRVHRLIAQAFAPNPSNKPEVDHINRNPSDNRVENLRWATPSQNQRNTAQNDRVDARGGTHYYEDEKKYMREYMREYYLTHNQFFKEKNDSFRKTHKCIRFSDGKRRYIPNADALELLKLPVKDRVWHPR